jgi:RHS repeat-associated protein
MLLWSHSQIQANGSTSTTNRQLTLAAGNNRLSQLSIRSTSYSYSYDPAGNLTQENTERHFEWDQSNRMRVFRVQPSGAPPSLYAQYLYDSAGQRVMKLVRDQSGGYETTIYVDGAFERQRSVTSSATVENNLLHVMDNQQGIALVRVGNALPGDGAPDKKIKYQFGDHLGSSNVVIDDTGALISREEYLPYGETSFGSFARKRYRFTGKERDAESGLYYHGARYYVPWLARWLTVDPILSNKDRTPRTNLYFYAHSNPSIFVDPLGYDIQVSSQSRLNAKELVAAIHGTESIPKPIRDAIQVSPDNSNAIRVNNIKNSSRPIPEWFESLRRASIENQWVVTTGTAVTGPGMVGYHPDLPHENWPGERAQLGNFLGSVWINKTITMGPGEPKGYIGGITVPYERWQLNPADSPPVRSNLTRGSGKQASGLGLVILAIDTRIQVKADGGFANKPLPSSEIAEAFIHEFALHAGRISGPTQTEISRDPKLGNVGPLGPTSMPSGHSDPKVKQWAGEIDMMFGRPPVDQMEQLKR